MTAADVVNNYDEKELARLFLRYGEEPMSRSIAKALIAARGKRRITTTGELSGVVRSVQGRRDLVIKTLARIYQALRIEVNDELGVLKKALEDGIESLSPGGRMAVISYHSLEDRIVKQFFAARAREDWGPKGVALREPIQKATVALITRKPLLAGEDEVQRNPRARSAKLRVIEKL
jgi:16S rRNA (cytosine1402-N4)-methyltransferase